MSSERFIAAPVGRVVIGPTWLVWAESPTFIGTSSWDEVTVEELELAIGVWVGLWAHVKKPLTVASDVSELTVVSPSAFQRLVSFIGSQLDRMADVGMRHVFLVKPDASELVAALTRGLMPGLSPRHEFLATPDPAAAAAWAHQPSLPARITQARALTAAARGEAPFVRALRDAIAARLQSPTLALVAQAMSLSDRTLQRQLQAHGTTFRDEVSLVRCRAAARLLADTSDKVATIARHVGFDSASHFASVFKKVHGVGPDEFRSRAGRQPA